MSKKDQGVDVLNLEGRLHDGSAYLLVTKSGKEIRVCDSAGPEGLWVRITDAQKVGSYVVFSGARSEPNGKLDGYAIIPANEILWLQNFPSSVGVTHEARLMQLEEAVGEFAGISETVEDIEQALLDKKILEAEEEPVEGGFKVVSEKTQAVMAAHDDEE